MQRPSSVLKELVENALDAKASTIKILIEDAGSRRIEVRDDGGMSAKDLKMCLCDMLPQSCTGERSFEIQTMGFRGEALAPLPRLPMLVESRQQGESTGHRLQIESGVVSGQEECACRRSAFIISDLFNIPARRIFLKVMEWK